MRRAALLLVLALLRPDAGAAQSPFAFTEEEGRLRLTEDGRPVLVYNHGMQLPPGVPEQYRRSGYVHPLYDLDGRVLSDDFPRDHYHHRGLSWMWPSVEVAGRDYDLWHLRGIRQRFERWLGRETDGRSATLGVQNAWHLEDRKVLEEEVWIRAHQATPRGRAIDVQLTLRPLEPIRIAGTREGNKGYGGFVFRFAPRADTRLATAEGVEPADTNHLRTPWADEAGRFAGAAEHSGLAIFQHPDNPGYPSPWTLRRYGFLGSAWPGLDGAVLEPGRPVTLRYRVWVHPGDAAGGGVAEAFRAFQSAPAAPIHP